MSWLALAQFCGWVSVILVAAVVRNRQAATFMGIFLGVYSLIALSLAPYFSRIFPLFVALDMVVFLNFVMLTRPRMRPFWYRILISWPSALFAAGTLLAMPWGIAMALGFHPWAPWLPYVLAAVGMAQSLSTKREEIDLVVDGPEGPRGQELVLPHPRGSRRASRPLRIVQISDPHLGPFMSVKRLARIAQRAVDANPDLILLTGDFLTMESQSDPDLLLNAMAPLKVMQGKTFACNGNHDHEAPAIVIRAMKENGIQLLVDEAREVQTEIGPVQIVGMDFTWRDRADHLARVCREYPRKQGIPRIVLLHDPGAFRHLPAGEGDLVLSGHTHGGQVGVVSLGLQWTFLRLFGIKIPDHGFWARGTDRMWVHRGTGHYGFPLRLGVPAEESVMRVHLGGSS